MSEKEKDTTGEAETNEEGRGEGIKGGIRYGLGMLAAMKDAIEETLKEAKERGDLTPERAKQVMRTTLEKAQEKAGEARDALDFVKQKEFTLLRELVDRLDTRVNDIEQKVGTDGGGPQTPRSKGS
jgi:polyhydroxyalkanoate synthesis regulator phasin